MQEGYIWIFNFVVSCSFITLVLLIPLWLLRWHTCGDIFLETMLILMSKRIPFPMDIGVRKVNAVCHFCNCGYGYILLLLMKDSMSWVLPVRNRYLWTKCFLIISHSNFFFAKNEFCQFSKSMFLNFFLLHNFLSTDSILHLWSLLYFNFDLLASIWWPITRGCRTFCLAIWLIPEYYKQDLIFPMFLIEVHVRFWDIICKVNICISCASLKASLTFKRSSNIVTSGHFPRLGYLIFRAFPVLENWFSFSRKITDSHNAKGLFPGN